MNTSQNHIQRMYPFVEPTAPNPDVGNLGMVNTKYHSNQYRQRMTSEREKETLQNERTQGQMQVVLDAVGHLSGSVNSVLQGIHRQDQQMAQMRRLVDKQEVDQMHLKEEVRRDIAHVLEILKKVSESVNSLKRRSGKFKDEKMGLSRCGNFLKYTMFLFNAVILIAGCGLLGFGVYLWTQQDSKIPQLAFLGSHYYQLLTLALIISGGVVIILSFFGCCGAIKEVKCMLTIFFLMLCVMLTSMIVGGVVAFVYKDTLEEVILETMTSSLNSSYGIVGHEEVTQTWDIIQTVLQCCGVFGGVNSTTSWAYYKHYSLWYTNKTEDAIHVFVPESCCKFGDLEPNRTICQTGRQDPEDMLRIPADVTVTEDTFNDNLFTDGCYTAVIDELKDKSQVLAIAFAVIGVLMMMGIVFSICLCRRINDEFIFD